MSSSLVGYAGPQSASGYGSGMKSPKGYKQFQNLSPEQMQLFQQMFSQTTPSSYLSKLAGGDQSTFDEMEAPALRQFNELQGGLASRFSGMGLGARKSSGFQNTSTAASSNFAQDLQSQRQQLQRQALMDLMGISQNLLGQQPYELIKQQEKPSFLQSLLGGLSPLAGAGIGGYFGGSKGAMTGGLIGSAASQGFQ